MRVYRVNIQEENINTIGARTRSLPQTEANSRQEHKKRTNEDRRQQTTANTGIDDENWKKPTTNHDERRSKIA